ncbi:hypothetical protein ACH4OT_13620 [Streptomyces murinus]
MPGSKALARYGMWRSPSGVTEDRNIHAPNPVSAPFMWRSPSGVTEDRNA